MSHAAPGHHGGRAPCAPGGRAPPARSTRGPGVPRPAPLGPERRTSVGCARGSPGEQRRACARPPGALSPQLSPGPWAGRPGGRLAGPGGISGAPATALPDYSVPAPGESMGTDHAVTGRERLEGSIIYGVVLTSPVWDFTSVAYFLPICCFCPSCWRKLLFPLQDSSGYCVELM